MLDAEWYAEVPLTSVGMDKDWAPLLLCEDVTIGNSGEALEAFTTPTRFARWVDQMAHHDPCGSWGQIRVFGAPKHVIIHDDAEGDVVAYPMLPDGRFNVAPYVILT